MEQESVVLAENAEAGDGNVISSLADAPAGGGIFTIFLWLIGAQGARFITACRTSIQDTLS